MIDINKEISRSLQESVNKANLSAILNKLKNDEIDTNLTRFVFILGVRYDGSVYFQGHGEISELEADGLRDMANDSVDLLIDQMFPQKEIE